MEYTTDPDYDYSEYTEAVPCTRDNDNKLGALLSILYYFMFAFSVICNGIVLIIICRFDQLTTVTNILLLNLVMSSLIFMISLPFMAVYMQLSNWIFGEVMCKIVSTVYYLGFYSSVLFLALLTFDRYLAILYPLNDSQVRNRKYAGISCTVVWLVSGLACIRPMIIYSSFFSSLDNKTFCEEYPRNLTYVDMDKLRKSGFYLQLSVFLIFPLIVIFYCYSRIAITVMSSRIASKFKTVRLIFIIVLLFFMCWTPFNVVHLMNINNEVKSECEDKQKLGYALQITRTIAYFYFCISPVFYTFVGKKFQNHFRHLLVKHFPKLKRHMSVSQNSRSYVNTKTTPNDYRDI
ncbi:C-C chemokine receptor type 3 [Maylandia zebra]|uniref:G-protein coupled receptors family 1 profile domain-containing protein n=1 Tax=Astatotilapia calliptera TaxID=8154 RepID=A0A3P8NQ97_ASTCA|nr:C-C chemokine receptor type 3-like [Astatotilapia calliptera]